MLKLEVEREVLLRLGERGFAVNRVEGTVVFVVKLELVSVQRFELLALLVLVLDNPPLGLRLLLVFDQLLVVLALLVGTPENSRYKYVDTNMALIV
jgi:hypothetical protein